MTTVRVALPVSLRTLAEVEGEVEVEVRGTPTIGSVLDALEDRYPTLGGTIRDHRSGRRRDYMRYFGAGEDLSHESLDAPLPESVAAGEDPLRVIGAIAGG